jgi:hypothetical protein
MVRIVLFLLSLGPACLPPVMHETWLVSDYYDSGWVADAEDNICGLSDLRTVRQPGVVDWDALMDATAEMRKLKREKIKKDSPEGVILVTKAESKCMKACTKQMRKTKVDSMWKKISHSSKLPWEQTDSVIDLIKNEEKKTVLFKWKETV